MQILFANEQDWFEPLDLLLSSETKRIQIEMTRENEQRRSALQLRLWQSTIVYYLV